jgi:hypothetical protein
VARKPETIAKVAALGEQLPKARPKESAAYTARILANLRDIAQTSGHAFLAHLLTIALLEASWLAER